MIRQSTVDLLREMRFGGMASELERQISDAESFRELSFEDRLALLVDAEWNRRQKNKYQRCLHNARLSIPNATVEGIEYYEDRKLSRKDFTLFSTCKYIEDKHHIIFKGASGNGKTYLACALGEAACRKHLSVRYIRMPELLDELCYAKANNEFKKVVKAYQKVDLLMCPTICLRSSKRGRSMDLLFSVLSLRLKAGTGGLTRIRRMTVRSPRRLWTGLFITLTRYSLTVIPR